MSKTVAEILIDRFLEDVDKTGKMPWQRPYKCYRDAFNWLTLKKYRGINRLILPFGEYLTKTQLNEYNKQHGEDFKFQKGIQWFPVCYFNVDRKEVTAGEVSSIFGINPANLQLGYIGFEYPWSYYKDKDGYSKQRSILRYYQVADIKHFRNSKGEMLPSRIEDGTVNLTASKPKEVFDDYIEFSGIDVVESKGVPCYIPSWDRVELNSITRSEASWYSTAFHEFAHSTGASSRLNRKLVSKEEDLDSYAKEECIAEITSYLLCCECGIEDFETSGSAEYNNQIAYVQGWKSRIKNWGNSFIYVCSQAEKAFNYILLNDDTEEEEDE